MASGLTIRTAERRDAAELAILVDISSHAVASWLWYGAVLDGSVDTALEKGRIVMRDDAREGWRGATIAEWDGDVAGMSISYRVEESAGKGSPPHPFMEPIFALQRLVIGNRLIDSLGVYSEHRGKGIGRTLVEHEISRAPDQPISLITESHNMTAVKLYRSCGFTEISRSAAVPRLPDEKRYEWVLLTRKPDIDRGSKEYGRKL